MIFLSDRMTSASGSIGGTTFSHTRSGMYTRARRVPVNTNTDLQVQVRSALTQIVTRWTEFLSPAQRDDWDTYAANVPVTNALGQSFNLSGQNWYLASNIPRVQLITKFPATGAPVADDAPMLFDRGTFTTPMPTTLSQSAGFLYTITASDEWTSEDGAFLLVFQGRPRNESRTFFAGPWRLLGAVFGDSTTPPVANQVFPPNTFPLFGFPIEVGQRVSFVAVVTRVDGRLSTRRTFADLIVQ